MYSSRSYKLTKEEYNYLLPVLRNKLSNRPEQYYFNGNTEELQDMLDRLKGLYDNYDEIKPIIIYKCFKECSLIPFRNELNVTV